MQLCPHCSTDLEDGARFCGACGRRIDPPVAAAAAKSGPARAPVEALAATMMSGPAAVPSAQPEVVRPPARPPETFIGRTLNHRYVVQDKIGEGGFGAVFRGKQIATGREVALKILHPHNLGDPTIVARFRREAEACSKLRDPHTVTTYDFDETEDGILYLAMELLRGRSLHHLQRSEGPFSCERVLGILDQVAESLGEAHDNGIVHRDMKPENVIVEDRGGQDYVKVLDFGIAKMMSGDREIQALTAVGQTLGTLEFMSPEQLRGIKLDGRSDIYALGMMAYEMLTGELPFKNAKTPIEIINFHMKDQSPPPSKLRPDLKIHPAVDDVLLKMVAKARDDRFADIRALRDQIARALKANSRTGFPLPAPRVMGLIGAVVAAAVGALIFLLRR
jgi:serine/threonine-protein kinase